MNEKMSAKILTEARKQQSELQDEYGIGIDNDQDNDDLETSNSNKMPALSSKLNRTHEEFAKSKKATDEFNMNFKSFKKLQTSRMEQQKIRKSDHDESETDSENEDQMEEYENKRDYYSDEDIVIKKIKINHACTSLISEVHA